MWSVGMALAVALVKSGAPLYLRSVVFIPFMLGSTMLLQAMYRTCVVHALRRHRALADGIERVANPEQVRTDTTRAKRIFMAASCVSTLATAVLLLVP